MNRHLTQMLLSLLLFASIIGISCTEEENKQIIKPITKTQVNGNIEKGPFLTGSKVTLYELDAQLNQTGMKMFTTETIDDNGSFSFNNKMELSCQFVQLEISGFFFNEVTGYRSGTQITLNALADVSEKDKVNVNIITHLEFKRAKQLVADGLSFSEAKSQADAELLKIFAITSSVKVPESISLTDGDESASMLLALSAILLYNHSEAQFSELVARLSNEFANSGKIHTPALLNEIQNGQKGVDISAVKKNIENYYKELGKTVSFNEMHRFIDRNANGVIDKEDEELVKEPQDQDDDIWTNEANFQSGLMNCYYKTHKYFTSATVLDAIRCKQINTDSPSEQRYLDQLLTSNSSLIRQSWDNAYAAIRWINLLIEMAETKNLTFNPTLFIAEARMLRAMLYTDMADRWGNLPLVTVTLNDPSQMPAQVSPETIYQFALDDLSKASQHLTQKNPRASVGLVYALTARIQLTRNQIQSALEATRRIINSGEYNLYPSGTIYNENNSEHIFSLSIPANNIGQYDHYFGKYLWKGDWHPLYRYTNILLNQAEAACQTGSAPEALKAINMVRLNQGMAPLENTENLKGEIASLWKNIIGSDYGYFALLKRLGIAINELRIKEYQLLFPIPEAALHEASEMIQNPGY